MKKVCMLLGCLVLLTGLSAAGLFDPAATGKLAIGYDGTSVVESGGAVTSWVDQIGNYDAAGAANLVTIDTGNGMHPVLSFSGAQSLRTSAFATPFAQTNVIFIVAALETPTASKFLVDGIASSARQGVYTRSDSSYGMYAGAQIINGNVVAQSNVFQVYTAIFSGTSSQLRIDGTKVLGVANAGTHSMTGLSIGADYNNNQKLYGKIAEVLVYDGGLNTVQLETIEAYLQNKYIQVPEPATLILLAAGVMAVRRNRK